MNAADIDDMDCNTVQTTHTRYIGPAKAHKVSKAAAELRAAPPFR